MGRSSSPVSNGDNIPKPACRDQIHGDLDLETVELASIGSETGTALLRLTWENWGETVRSPGHTGGPLSSEWRSSPIQPSPFTPKEGSRISYQAAHVLRPCFQES